MEKDSVLVTNLKQANRKEDSNESATVGTNKAIDPQTSISSNELQMLLKLITKFSKAPWAVGLHHVGHVPQKGENPDSIDIHATYNLC